MPGSGMPQASPPRSEDVENAGNVANIVQTLSAEKEIVPTPMRRRGRAASAGPPRRRQSEAAAPDTLEEAKESPEPAPNSSGRSKKHVAGVVVGLLLVVAGLTVAVLRDDSSVRKVDDIAVEIVPMVKEEHGSQLFDTIRDALSCSAPRRNVLDVLVGASPEFGAASDHPEEILELSRLATQVGVSAASVAATELISVQDRESVEHQLARAIAGVASGEGSWPAELRRRLSSALNTPCGQSCVDSGIVLEVDGAATSEPASTQGGRLQRAVIDLGYSAGLPGIQSRAAAYRSRPVEVVTDTSSPSPGDCFAFRGVGSIALRVAESAVVKHVVIEQLPRWSLPNGGNPPRHFTVYGEPADAKTRSAEEGASHAESESFDVPSSAGEARDTYTAWLGDFTYPLAAPSAQTFELRDPVEVQGLRFHFHEPSWGENFTCVYRLRAFASTPCGSD
eukprot:CAMPEP_0194478628 /NCGR_PEP_ID=MMETSP0253-20130528/2006_1 /TAXON_ID=2966 /ORGANISM="Noctiluca scintillans" /LENGTH=449 /DNA_ID=CAMNT_0039317741 /DNA_START=44 /DNA_END=1393 /DNA_ORIENTATION=+